MKIGNYKPTMKIIETTGVKHKPSQYNPSNQLPNKQKCEYSWNKIKDY